MESPYFSTTAVTDPNGHTSTTYTDALGRTVKQKSGAGGETTYGYDVLGRLSGIVNPIGEVYTYEYNDMDRLYKKTIPGASDWYFYWDHSYRPHIIQRSNGAYEIMQYDKHNRVLGIYSPTSVPTPTSHIVEDDYAAALYLDNRAVKKNVYASNQTWTSEEKDRILKALPDLGGWKTSDFTRDSIGRITFADVNYDNLYKVKQNFEYSDAGMITNTHTEVQAPTGLIDTVGFAFEFNEVLLPTKTTLIKGEESTVLSLIGNYERDLPGQKLIGHSGDNGYLQAMNYGYDELGRLVRINFPGTTECLIDDGFCEMSTNMYIYPTASNACWFLAAIQLEDNLIQLNPQIDLRESSAVIDFEQLLDSLLNAYGYFGEVEIETEIQGSTSSDPIKYTISVTNSLADKVFFSLEDSHGKPCAKRGLTQGVCCDPELIPTGVGGIPPIAHSPNPGLFYEKITYDGIDINQIDMSLDCNLGLVRNDYTYDGDHRITQQANTLLGTIKIPDAYSTSYGYDAAGNIQTLNRRGFTGMDGNDMLFNDIDWKNRTK